MTARGVQDLPQRLAGIVLAGGAGTRLGRPKAGVPFHGEPLAARAVRMLRDAGCDDVVVSARSDRPPPLVEARVVWDPPDADGVLDGLHAALLAVDAPDVLVVACDLPLCGPLLARLAGGPGGRAVVAVDEGGRAQPLCARYRRVDALLAAERALASGDRRVRRWAEAQTPVLEAALVGELANCNSPDDLAAALTSASRSG